MTFTRIYRDRCWNPEGTRSGPGSSDEATSRLLNVLPMVVASVGARSVLDAACGEATWTPKLPGYWGCDTVGEAIEIARERWPARRFFVADIRIDPLPPVDVVLCRDALMHMSLADGMATLRNLRRSGRWLLATTHARGTNQDIATGGFYRCRLEDPPFSLGRPLLRIADDWRDPDRCLGLWAMIPAESVKVYAPLHGRPG